MTSNSGATRAGQATVRARSSVKADAAQTTDRRDGSDSTEQTKKETVRLSLDVSIEFNALIGELATDSNSTKSDVLRRAVTLLKVACDAKKQGKKVGIAERDQPLATEIIWLWVESHKPMTENLGNKLDLDNYAERHNWKLEVTSEEHPQDRDFRHVQRTADAKLQRIKDSVLLGVAAFFILALATSCMAISFSHASSPDDKKWAWATLTLIAGAALGYLFGKASGATK